MEREIIFFDERGGITEDKEKATSAVIRELDEDGNLINETFLRKIIDIDEEN